MTSDGDWHEAAEKRLRERAEDHTSSLIEAREEGQRMGREEMSARLDRAQEALRRIAEGFENDECLCSGDGELDWPDRLLAGTDFWEDHFAYCGHYVRGYVGQVLGELAGGEGAGDRLIVAPDLPDARDLLFRGLRSLGRVLSHSASGVRWGAVAEVYGLGSTYATRLCRAAGLDPEERIGITEWQALEQVLGESFDEAEWSRVTGGAEIPPEEER